EAPVKDPNCEEPPMTFFTSDGADCPADAIIDVEVGDIIDNTGLFTIAGLDLGTMNMQLAPCFTDNCTDDLTYVVRNVDNGDPSETCSKTIVVEIEAVDDCGNVSVDALVCTFIIVDDVAPELEMPVVTEGDITCDDISVEDVTAFANGTLTPEEEAAFLDAAAALFVSNGLIPTGTTDDCNDSDYEEISIDVTLGDDCDIATLICTFVAVDVCGNTSEPASTSLNLIDDTAPVITCPADVEVDCTADNSPASTGMATATDDCGQEVAV
ncbi:hypothetical protein O3Q51_18385, partial [Cryomorphaceae bacterium 1068]|nr:hypothetical protein [Cryomorphaceae bacterium 1068]